jgi:hypothetical protein
VKAVAESNVGGSSQVSAIASWNDIMKLGIGVSSSAPHYLAMKFQIDAMLTETLGQALAPASTAVDLTLSTGGAAVTGHLGLEQTASGNVPVITSSGAPGAGFFSTFPGTIVNISALAIEYDFKESLTFRVPLSSDLVPPFGLYGPFNATVTANVSGENFGDAEADVSHTISLVSVTLPDGNTPESEGYTLSFASGLGSPNAPPSSVPEPVSLVLLATGLPAGLMVWRRLRRPMGARGAEG